MYENIFVQSGLSLFLIFLSPFLSFSPLISSSPIFNFVLFQFFFPFISIDFHFTAVDTTIVLRSRDNSDRLKYVRRDENRENPP